MSQNPSEVPDKVSKMDSDQKDNVARVIDGSSKDALANENSDEQFSLIGHKSSLAGKHVCHANIVSDNMTTYSVEQENVVGDRIKAQVDSIKYNGKLSKTLFNQVEVEEKVKSTKDSSLLDTSSSTKAKLDSSAQPFEDRNINSLDKSKIGSYVKELKAPISTMTTTNDKTKSNLGKDSLSLEKKASKKLKLEEKMTKLSNGNVIKGSSRQSPDVGTRTKGQIMEVTRRPEAVSCVVCMSKLIVLFQV